MTGNPDRGAIAGDQASPDLIVNPWPALPDRPPFVLPEDAAVLKGLQRRDYGLHLEVLPVPYAGDPARATVCILTLNPGFVPGDVDDLHLSQYVEQRRAALTFGADWPFPYLDPALASTGGGRYWQARLEPLVRAVGDARRVADRLFVAEHFPYASPKFDALPVVLPSQVFTFGLVGQLARRGCLMIVARRLREWQLAVTELVERPAQVVVSRVPRSGYISARTVGADQFSRVVTAIRS